MKVDYVAAYAARFPSTQANSIHMIRMCEAFAANGHDVVLYATDLGYSPSQIYEFYGVRPCFQIALLKSRLPKVNRLWHCLQAVRRAKARGSHRLVTRSAIAAYLGVRGGIEAVFDAHGPIAQRNVLERLCYRALLGSQKRWRMTTNSSALKAQYQADGLEPRTGITVAYNGAANLQVTEGITLGGRPEALQVGYTGHLYPGRGIGTICAVARALPDIDVHIVGGSPEDVATWKERANLANLYFHGFVKPTHVPSYLRMFDVLLAPYESSGVTVAGGGGDAASFMNPVKVMEYMVSGRAIIASDLPAIRDVVPEGAALFAQPDDPDDWVSCVRRLSDVHLREELGAASVAALRNVSWRDRADLLLGPNRLS